MFVLTTVKKRGARDKGGDENADRKAIGKPGTGGKDSNKERRKFGVDQEEKENSKTQALAHKGYLLALQVCGCCLCGSRHPFIGRCGNHIFSHCPLGNSLLQVGVNLCHQGVQAHRFQLKPTPLCLHLLHSHIIISTCHSQS